MKIHREGAIFYGSQVVTHNVSFFFISERNERVAKIFEILFFLGVQPKMIISKIERQMWANSNFSCYFCIKCKPAFLLCYSPFFCSVSSKCQKISTFFLCCPYLWLRLAGRLSEYSHQTRKTGNRRLPVPIPVQCGSANESSERKMESIGVASECYFHLTVFYRVARLFRGI